MTHALIVALVAAGLFAGMLVLFAWGRRLGIARRARDASGPGDGTGLVETSEVGLLGLLVAFTFFGAAQRFETRRLLVGQEANAIGTAWLRVDSLPEDVQPGMRDLFRRYVDKRLDTYRDGDLSPEVDAKLDEGAALQQQIWTTAVTACRRPGVPVYAPMLLLPALNDMIDITTTRVVASRNHPPLVIYVLLGGLHLVSALLVGYVASGTKSRSWFHILILAATTSVTFYVILDLEFPRLGLIRVDAADQTLIDLRRSMR